MIRGDLNENGKIDDQDAEWISLLNVYAVDFSPYLENDEWWRTCYYSIIGDINSDGSCDVGDEATIYEYLSNVNNIESGQIVFKYDSYDTDLNWWEIELQNYNY